MPGKYRYQQERVPVNAPSYSHHLQVRGLWAPATPVISTKAHLRAMSPNRRSSLWLRSEKAQAMSARFCGMKSFVAAPTPTLRTTELPSRSCTSSSNSPGCAPSAYRRTRRPSPSVYSSEPGWLLRSTRRPSGSWRVNGKRAKEGSWWVRVNLPWLGLMQEKRIPVQDLDGRAGSPPCYIQATICIPSHLEHVGNARRDSVKQRLVVELHPREAP